MKGVIAAAVVLMSLGASQQTFRVNVDAVPVDVLVTDGNRPVGGLRASDFELRDSGVLQRIESVSFEDVPLSMMLALDASSSVDGQPLRNLKQAGSAVIGLLGPGDRGAVLTFSEEVDLSSAWTADHQQLAAGNREGPGLRQYCITRRGLRRADPQGSTARTTTDLDVQRR